MLAEVERLQTETNLRLSQEQLARILASTMDAIVTFDSARRIIFFNESAENIFRRSAGEAIGGTLDPFLTEGLRRLLDSVTDLSSAKSAARPFLWAPEGIMARRANGEEFAIEATISKVETQSGNLFTLILRDIRERLRSEAEVRQLNLQKEYLLEEIKEAHNFEQIVGQSRSLSEVFEETKLVAGTDASVLILGETGTGKELIARAVHSNSQRKNHPLIRVSCAALPTGLVESELFGHEKGAFTGARERRIGRFELANAGTIFLDEIGEVPVDVQVKLLRVLQEREFERVGGRDPIRVDVRVIAATNRDLQRAVAENRFRQDLYYRLNVFPLKLPPLRDRRADIPLLVQFFVQRFASKIGRSITRVPADTMQRLTNYSWPGNVRELENVIERAVILSRGSDLEIAAEALPEHQAAAEKLFGESIGRSALRTTTPSDSLSLEEVERGHILGVLCRTNWKIDGENGAARFLNLNPSTLRSRIKKLGIRRSSEGVS